VQVKGPDGDPIIEKDRDSAIFYDGPLIVLTSRFSASASEILAGALQDYDRALIVGDSSTHGKGTVQSLLQLGPIMRQRGFAVTNNPGALKITIRKFYRASGASTENRGVLADITLPSLWNDSTEVGETTLDNHLPYDTIESSRYQKVNMVQPELAELVKRSNQRTATNKEFARYLDMSIKSANETEGHLLSARDLELVPFDIWRKHSDETVEIRKMIFGYRKKVLSSPRSER